MTVTTSGEPAATVAEETIRPFQIESFPPSRSGATRTAHHTRNRAPVPRSGRGRIRIGRTWAASDKTSLRTPPSKFAEAVLDVGGIGR
jgi:hypothetical protein